MGNTIIYKNGKIMEDMLNAKVLVVDDDPKARDFLVSFLAKEKCVIRQAEDGRKALSICERFKPQIVLLDINMPVMDGLQVLKRIKAKYPEIQVVMTTGESSLKATLETHKYGAFTHVIKPIHLDKLLVILKRALGIDKGFHTKSAKEQTEEDKELLEHFHDETVTTKLDALLAILHENGLVTEAELLDKINEIKGFK
jgi:DNA-binding NtrC family response regulator